MAAYYIGANDEHGQNPPTAGKRTPVLPYVNRSFYENEYNRPAKNCFIQACLRCGFDVFDVKPELTDISVSRRVQRINAQRLTLLVTFGYNAFGSGSSFNSAAGILTFYAPQGRRPEESRVLAEETYRRLSENSSQPGRGVAPLYNVGVLQSVNCPSTLVEPGFMTNFDEAKLMLDPDYHVLTAEDCCQGVCECLGADYLPRRRENLPLLRTGSRGNFVELLQFTLNTVGFSLSVDGIFGSATRQAVTRYQTDNGLVADGIVGKNTWKTLMFMPTYPTLRKGNRGSYVRYLQSKLTTKLYPCGIVDGIFGGDTERALKQFQQENALAADGIAGKNTWEVLSKIGGGRPLTQ